MNYIQKLITDIECHSAEGIKTCFEHGIDPNQLYNGRPLIEELIGAYTRSAGFKDCIKIFVDYGLVFENKALLSVLLDDRLALEALIAGDPGIVTRRYTLPCAFTQLEDVTLLHICAEYNHLSCAKALVKHHADINAKAGTDSCYFGGQTPIFHTVNQHRNFSMELMQFLISQSADLKYTVNGLIWGKGYEWETFIPAVNPVSYAMMGLLRQFQRTEKDIYEVVRILMKASCGLEYTPANIPNRYLSK